MKYFNTISKEVITEKDLQKIYTNASKTKQLPFTFSEWVEILKGKKAIVPIVETSDKIKRALKKLNISEHAKTLKFEELQNIATTAHVDIFAVMTFYRYGEGIANMTR